MKLIILKLDRLTTELELKSVFEKFGTVQSCNLVVNPGNGASKGFAFVEMPNNDEAKVAINKLNNRTLGKCRIRVKMAEDKKE